MASLTKNYFPIPRERILWRFKSKWTNSHFDNWCNSCSLQGTLFADRKGRPPLKNGKKKERRNRNLDLVFARVGPRENMWWKEESFAVHWSLHSTKKTFSLMNSTKLPLWGDERSCLTFSSYYTQGSHNRSSQKLVCLQIYHNQTRQFSSIL